MNSLISPTKSLLFASSLLALGCSNSNFSGSQANQDAAIPPSNDAVPAASDSFLEEFTVQATSATTDIVFAIDTSSSMEEEIANIENNMQNFIALLDAAKLNVQIIALGADFNFPEDPRIKAYPTEVDSHNAIGVLSDYFETQADLRPNVNLNTVIVSDDNGEQAGNLAGDFMPPETAVDVKVHAIVGLVAGQDPNNPQCTIENVGAEHQTLAKNTSGLIQDICINDWSKLVTELSKSIISSTTSSFALEKTIDPSLPAIVVINGEIIEQVVGDVEQYSIDYSNNSISFANEVVLTKGDKISIEYYLLP